jgi:hypothetical protein
MVLPALPAQPAKVIVVVPVSLSFVVTLNAGDVLAELIRTLPVVVVPNASFTAWMAVWKPNA